MSITPTPAPVTVSRAHDNPASQPAAEPAARGLRRLRAIAVGALALAASLVVARSASRDPAFALSSALPRPAAAASASLIASSLSLHPLEARTPADQHLRRDGYSTVRGGVVYIPGTFSSIDGAYDLLIHFHGNVKVIVESAEVAQVNAIVAVINLGVGSAVYENAYAAPGTYEALIEQIHHTVTERGLENATVRRVALSSWSAGYGAISTILQVRRGTEPLDALMLSDGLHCGRLPERPSALNNRQLAPFVKAARQAAEGKLLFAITHSEIDPVTYVGSGETASYLLDAVRDEAPTQNQPLVAPAHLQLKAAVNAVEPSLEKKLEPTRDVRVGDLHVRGFRGQTREHHSSHLLQIGATLMPELAQRWNQ